VISAYLAASAVAVIVAGPVIDAIGVRRTFRITGAWFFLWSAAAAIAPTMPLLIVARAMQGVGGGLVMAVALAAVGLTYPSGLRPRAFAANSMVWGVMGFGGPALAGLLLAVGDWRLIFVVQLPITGLALVIGWNALPGATADAVRTPFDPIGVGLLTVLTLGSLVAVSEIGDRWDVFAGGLVAGVAAIAAYWAHARRAAAPVVARRHITRFPAVGIHAVMALTLIAGLAIDNYLPIYVQVNRGYDESVAAFTLAFLAVGWTAGSIVYSRVFAGLVPAAVMRAGMTLVAIGCIAVAATVAWDAPLAVVFAGYTVVGLGIGTVSTPSLTWLQASSEPGEMGRATSAHQFLRQLAITYGVAAGGAVLLLVVARQVDDVDAVREALAGEDVELGAGAAAAIGDGLATVAVVSAGIAVLGVAIATAVLRRARQTVTNGVRPRL
jgi:predicted MFS family arabinose efflux permease